MKGFLTVDYRVIALDDAALRGAYAPDSLAPTLEVTHDPDAITSVMRGARFDPSVHDRCVLVLETCAVRALVMPAQRRGWSWWSVVARVRGFLGPFLPT